MYEQAGSRRITSTMLKNWSLSRLEGIGVLQVTFVEVRQKVCSNQGTESHSLRKAGTKALEGRRRSLMVWDKYRTIRMRWGCRKKYCDVGCCGVAVLIRRVFRCVRS